MGTGYLTIQARAGNNLIPVSGAHVQLKNTCGKVLYASMTDPNGSTASLPLPAPPMALTLDPANDQPVYSLWDVEISAKGFVTTQIHGIEILDTQTTILPIHMQPMPDQEAPAPDHIIDIPPSALLEGAENRQFTAPVLSRVLKEVVIPEKIVVHLGTPSNRSAENIAIPFTDYIKNVVSSEIYATWPINALMANLHVIVTFALNRIYTEWYRSRGYNFDITNSTSYDQCYREGGPVFQNINDLVDTYFNVFIHRYGFKNPLFTQFCNGTTVTCAGLSQWGTVTLANQGKSVIEILRYYYPADIVLTASQNIAGIPESYPGKVLKLGSRGENVVQMQQYLNRIHQNYAAIPLINNPNGIFDSQTQNAVVAFQRIFNLPADGIIGRTTWNKIASIYVGISRLSELESEGERISIGQNPPSAILSQGARGEHVRELQFILNYIAPYYYNIPSVTMDGIYGPRAANAVKQFQQTFGLRADGVVGPATWQKLYSVFRGIEQTISTVPETTLPQGMLPPYPGTLIRIGSRGSDVKMIQECLNHVNALYPSIPVMTPDGIFGENTRRAVVAFQQAMLLSADGIVGPQTWNALIKQCVLAFNGQNGNTPVYPGNMLRLWARGEVVRILQEMLNKARKRYPSLPPVSTDAIFGPNTQSAVIMAQRELGLAPDGIVGPDTWNALAKFW